MASISQGAELACPCRSAGPSAGTGQGQLSSCWHLLTPLPPLGPRGVTSQEHPFLPLQSRQVWRTILGAEMLLAAPVHKAARGIPALIFIFYQVDWIFPAKWFMEPAAASYRWAEFVFWDRHLHSYKSEQICINTEHSQLPVNLSRRDQGQHSRKQEACKKLPSCQHHIRKRCPVCRSPTQAWLLWTGVTAAALGQALHYVAPYLYVWLICEAAISDAGQGKQKTQVCVAGCFSVLSNSCSLTSLPLNAQTVLLCTPPAYQIWRKPHWFSTLNSLTPVYLSQWVYQHQT